MEVARLSGSRVKSNSPNCSVREYQTENPDIDIATAVIGGREPSQGVAENTVSTELARVLQGGGSITVDGKRTHIGPGDVVIIEPGEKFFWDGEMKIEIVCTPRWSVDQHIIHKDK